MHSELRHCSRCRRGFTLVELLTVVGIIALLIGMLLPSLNRAKYLTRLAVCGSNVNGLTKAMIVYTTENEGYIPLLFEGGSAWVKQFNYCIGHAGRPEPDMGAPWGSIYVGEQASHKMMFCPAARERPLATFNTKLFQWEQYTDSNIPAYWFGDPNVSNDYYMNVGYAVRPITSRRRAYGSGLNLMPRTTRLTGGTAIITDIVSTPYYASGHHFPVITVGYLDGSVVRYDGNSFSAAWHALPEITYDAAQVMLTDDGTGGIYAEMDRHTN